MVFVEVMVFAEVGEQFIGISRPAPARR